MRLRIAGRIVLACGVVAPSLRRPLSEAILIAAGGAVVAWVWFRLAETADDPESW